MSKIIENNIERDMTSEEVIEHEALRAEATAKKEAIATAKTAEANAKVSGNTKLLGLGLTQAEATALTGFTPSED